MYNDPPWVFTGRALYQLQLVKSEEVGVFCKLLGCLLMWSMCMPIRKCAFLQAKKRIPAELKLVEAFG